MRRSYRRFPVALAFQVNGRSLGKSKDLSLSGAFIKTVMRPAVGTRHQIAIGVDNETIECDAQVVRHEHDGIALAFGGVPQALERALIRVLGPGAEHVDDFRLR
jgi:hypothetical protein